MPDRFVPDRRVQFEFIVQDEQRRRALAMTREAFRTAVMTAAPAAIIEPIPCGCLGCWANQGRPQERALEVLRSCLTPAQRKSMDQLGYFDVTGSRGGVYRIFTRVGFTGNVRQTYLDGLPGRGYCAHGREPMPDYDHFLIQKLTIEADEGLFLRTAF